MLIVYANTSKGLKNIAQPQEVIDATRAYIEDNDKIQEFINNKVHKLTDSEWKRLELQDRVNETYARNIYNVEVDKEYKMSKDKFVNALKQRKIECLKSNGNMYMRNIVLKENWLYINSKYNLRSLIRENSNEYDMDLRVIIIF